MAGPSLAAFVAAALAEHHRRSHPRFACQLGPLTLPTKGLAQGLCQAILQGVPLETLLPAEFTPVLLAMLDLHPRKAEKLAYGCQGFLTLLNPPDFIGDNRGFYVITERPAPPIGVPVVDLRNQDVCQRLGLPGVVSFSYLTCFQPHRGSRDVSRRLTDAARNAIGISQWLFRQRHFTPGMLCPRCPPDRPTVLHTLDDAQADHVAPKFREILAAFVVQHGMPPADALIDVPTWGCQFVAETDKAYFEAFHDARAVRELVCAACNMAAERRT